MPSNPVARWGARVPLWQLFVYFTVAFGGLMWAFHPHETFVLPVAEGLFYGLAMTGVFAVYRRRDRAASGVGTGEVADLDRAIQLGAPPADPYQRTAMVRLIERRRRHWHRQRLFGPILFTVFLVLGVLLVVIEGPWPNVLFVIVFAGGDVLAVVQPIRYLRRLDRMTSLLAQEPRP